MEVVWSKVAKENISTIKKIPAGTLWQKNNRRMVNKITFSRRYDRTVPRNWKTYWN
jgi:hypothetical protein